MARQRVASTRETVRRVGVGDIDDADDTKDKVDSSKVKVKKKQHRQGPSGVGAAAEWFSMLVLVAYMAHHVDNYQSNRIARAQSAEEAGIRGFSEATARKHVVSLTEFGPHPVGSKALEEAFEYVHSELKDIAEGADEYVNVEIDVFEPTQGFVRMKGGLFYGKTLVYTNLKHLVVRISPYHYPSSRDNAILISSHIDTVFTSPGAGDCSSCISVMLELVRALSHWASGFKHSVIFLFNTGEEEGLIGAHSFMTQHDWNETIRAAIDIESTGVGGRSTLFQAGPDSWLLKLYASVARFPSGHIVAQDAFQFGILKSATDFQVYREVGGLSGLDFAYMENSAVYHTKNDKIENLRPGSLQQLGDDLLALLQAAAISDHLEFLKTDSHYEKMDTVYFDVLGKWMISFPFAKAKTVQTHLIFEGLLLLAGSLYITGYSAFIEFGLALLTTLSTWIISVACVVIAAMILPLISTFPTPYIVHPWLMIGLFGAPAIFGALVGNFLGRSMLMRYLVGKGDTNEHAKWHSERWLFKGGVFQWILVLALGTMFDVKSSYMAISWILPPAIAFGLCEAQFSPRQRLAQLQRLTLWLSMAIGVLTCAQPVIRFTSVLTGSLVRLDRNPGSIPLWLGNVVIGALVAIQVCLMLIYMLPYAHRSGGLRWILMGLSGLFLSSLLVVNMQLLPAFTEDVGRGMHVVHVIDTTGMNTGAPEQYISLSSSTTGTFENELAALNDKDFECRTTSLDFVSYKVNYGCRKTLKEDKDLSRGIPTLRIESDKVTEGQRLTIVILDSGSSYRWNLAINTTAVQAFKLDSGKKAQGVLVPGGTIVGVDGWHNVQFTSTADGPTRFRLTLLWHPIEEPESGTNLDSNISLLKIRTDLSFVTDELAHVLQKLPKWCALFGKSTAPLSLAYLADL